MKSSKVLVLILAGMAGSAAFTYLFWPDVAKYMQMGRQQSFLGTRITEEESKGIRLKKEQESLAKDPLQIEKVAREKLGLSRPREIIYKFDEDGGLQAATGNAPEQTRRNARPSK